MRGWLRIETTLRDMQWEPARGLPFKAFTVVKSWSVPIIASPILKLFLSRLEELRVPVPEKEELNA